MADTKITDLAALAVTPASGDLFVVVDVDDTSMAGSGTDKQIAWSVIAAAFEVAGAVADHVADSDPHADRAYADSIVADLSGVTDPAAARTNLGLGSAATQSAAAFEPAGTAVSVVAMHEADTTNVHGIADTSTLYRAGGTDVAVADGGTGASDAATARTNLGALGGALGATDNALLRADGTGGATAQGSPGGGFPATLSDANVLSLPVSGSTLAFNPANGGVTMGQTWGIIISTANATTILTGASDFLMLRNFGTNTGFQMANAVGATVLGVMRNANDQCEINNGTPGTLRDVKPRNMILPFVSPAQITGNQNNYAPTRAGKYRLSSDASRDITGLSIAQVDGDRVTVYNVGANNIVLKHQDTNSTAANRFLSVTGADITIAANEAALLDYDGTDARWRVSKL